MAATPVVSTVNTRPRIFGFLPPVEGVDQIKPRPRHIHVWAGFPLAEHHFYHAYALVEREPCRAGMPGQHLVLLDGGVEAELERGVPTHLTGKHPIAH